MSLRRRLIALAIVAVAVLLGAAPAAEACLLEPQRLTCSVAQATRTMC